MSEQPTVVIDGVTYVPAPPTEEAPKPEPVARWWSEDSAVRDQAWLRSSTVLTIEEGQAAADALNALDRDGVAWGEPRPMSELPDRHEFTALMLFKDGTLKSRRMTSRRDDAPDRRAGWYGPLPEVTR